MELVPPPARFLTPLIVEKIGPRLWKLKEPLVFYSAKYSGQFIAPAGFVTNFGSIPRLFWILYPPVDDYDPATVIHDCGYNHQLISESGARQHTVKSVIDPLFYEAMIACKVREKRAKFMYKLVSRFGRTDPTPWLT